jgi:hypothetical protein
MRYRPRSRSPWPSRPFGQEGWAGVRAFGSLHARVCLCLESGPTSRCVDTQSCADGTLCVGVTNDFDERSRGHDRGRCSRHARMRRSLDEARTGAAVSGRAVPVRGLRLKRIPIGRKPVLPESWAPTWAPVGCHATREPGFDTGNSNTGWQIPIEDQERLGRISLHGALLHLREDDAMGGVSARASLCGSTGWVSVPESYPERARIQHRVALTAPEDVQGAGLRSGGNWVMDEPAGLAEAKDGGDGHAR